ncbi:MAG: hypothetical protein M3463_07510 [Verrucomicrobiota bacterium]|nr:hypothetical protein [Verrucomicrobiota bacterium]
MKKLLFAFLLFVGVAAVAPQAQAGHDSCGTRVIRYYDNCGRPVYGYVQQRYSYPRPVYYAPVRRYYDSRPSYYSRPQNRCYDSRSRISFSFGF